MHVSTLGRLITFRLECAGNDGVRVLCPIPLSVPGARLVSGDRVNRAHSIFRTPRGCSAHTAHSFMQGSQDDHVVIVACHDYLGQANADRICLRRAPVKLLIKMQGR